MNFFKPNMKKHWTHKYDEGFSGHEPDSNQIEAALKDALGPGSVLELGAGAGHFTALVREWGYDITATDLVVGQQLDITKEKLGEFDNVIAMGMLHHILDHDKFVAALENIKAMAQKRIIIGVKLPSERLRTKTRHSYRYSVLDYIEVFGNPVTVTACGYLSLLEWEVKK
jgi:cyclopropane fatty-acyl-phospholipid synthase-like methyltransferase